MTHLFSRDAVVIGGLLVVVTGGGLSCGPSSSGSASADTTVQATAQAESRLPAVDTAATDAPAPSQPTSAPVIEYYPATRLGHVGDSLSRTRKTGDVLSSHATFQTIELRRPASGVPEVHDRWTDVMMFQSGRAAVLLGGRVTGNQLTAPGEHRGGTISGGHSQPVGPGDMLVIPSGIPHQIQIASGDSLRYITIKVPRS